MLAAFGGMLVVFLCVDMGIKQYIEDTFDRREERKCIVPGLVLRKVYNRGFLLSTLEKYPKIVQGASAVTGVVILFYDLLLFLKKGKWLEKTGMIFLTAGAASNIYDRLVAIPFQFNSKSRGFLCYYRCGFSRDRQNW